jgi:hypothetical protein
VREQEPGDWGWVHWRVRVVEETEWRRGEERRVGEEQA